MTDPISDEDETSTMKQREETRQERLEALKERMGGELRPATEADRVRPALRAKREAAAKREDRPSKS